VVPYAYRFGEPLWRLNLTACELAFSRQSRRELTLVGHTESMEYVGRVPAPPLDRFIDDIYCLTGVPRHRRMNVPPMPSAHLFVNLGGPVHLWDCDPSVPPAVFTDGWFMGVWTRHFLFEYPTRVRLVGVHFKPWGISPFVDMPASELRDRWVPVDAVWQRSLDRIRNQVGDIASASETVRVLEEELRSRLAEALSRGLDLVEHTGGRLEISHGAVPVGALADAAGVSGRRPASGRLVGARSNGGLLRPGPLHQGVQGLHRPHPDGLPGPAAPIPRRAGVPAGQRSDAR
jgi:hypothetical protein